MRPDPLSLDDYAAHQKPQGWSSIDSSSILDRIQLIRVTLSSSLILGLIERCPSCGESAWSTGRITNGDEGEALWLIAFSCKSCAESFCTPAPEGFLPFIRYVYEADRGQVRTSECWREEVRRISRATSYLRTITDWIHGHAELAVQGRPLSLVYSADSGLTPSFVEIRGRQIQTALMRGGFHRVEFDGTGLRIAGDLLERRTLSPLDLAGRFFAARDCVTMDFFVSSSTFREFDAHFSDFVEIVATHLRRSTESATGVFVDTVRRIATSLADLEILPQSRDELAFILTACRSAPEKS